MSAGYPTLQRVESFAHSWGIVRQISAEFFKITLLCGNYVLDKLYDVSCLIMNLWLYG